MPHPLRTVLAAALSCVLGCLLLLATPAGVQATGQRHPARAVPGPSAYGPSEAEAVLHRAARLVRRGPAVTKHAASADLTMVLRDLHLARPALVGADRRAADRLLSRPTPAANARRVAPAVASSRRCSAHVCLHYSSSTTRNWATTTLNTM